MTDPMTTPLVMTDPGRKPPVTTDSVKRPPMRPSPVSTPLGAKPVFLARDPRFLIAGFALVALSAFVVQDTQGLLVVLLYVLVLHRLAGLSLRYAGRTSANVASFIVLVVAINAVLVKGEPFSASIPFVSREGLGSGVRAAVRILVLYAGLRVFLAVAPAEEIARGISSFLAPFSKKLARRAAMYGFLTAGFIPLFIDETRRITVAQKFRGGGLDGGFLGKLRGVRLLLVPLVLSAIHRSAELAAVVELRRIRSTIGGILVLEKVTRRDYLFLAATVTVVATAQFLF
jgi:energy-coupling factor transporter transmembrane protein EcfT